MTVQHFHLARIEHVPDWLRLGWIARPILEGTHHAQWSVAMQWLCDCPMAVPRKIPLKLARPREIPLLKMAGYEVIGPWDQSFTLMQLPRETKFDPDADAEHLAAAVADLNDELARCG